jgi:hypothetical protein
VLVHGDSHYVKLDKPLRRDDGKVLGNFTRVVDPRSRSLFVFQPMIVAATDN